MENPLKYMVFMFFVRQFLGSKRTQISNFSLPGGHVDAAWLFAETTGLVSGGEFGDTQDRLGCQPYPFAQVGVRGVKRRKF